MTDNLYAWQSEAKSQFLASTDKVFSCTACPGAGKTRFALSLAKHSLAEGKIDAVIVTVHSVIIKQQWLTAGNKLGVSLSNRLSAQNLIVTHQTYAGNEQLIEQLRSACCHHRILLISGEHHHLNDSKTWGESFVRAFEQAERILLLSGTHDVKTSV